jgi:hypothetical protein
LNNGRGGSTGPTALSNQNTLIRINCMQHPSISSHIWLPEGGCAAGDDAPHVCSAYQELAPVGHSHKNINK